ncbi:unnamed protein product [Spirodela intermedia]|uniref:Uncharacterized protein n=1 Tax=Spirodela intermedia TaxID=51605 RepID=A0A7I8LM73_SPIIN|nr:unnamed protein product [Spirodela intermedia]
MILEISNTCMLLAIAKDIWDDIYQTYSRARDSAYIYELKMKMMTTKQGNKIVIEYANQLKMLWQEYDHDKPINMTSPKEGAIYKDYAEHDRTYGFLAGLDPKFDQLRVQILEERDYHPSMSMENTTFVARGGNSPTISKERVKANQSPPLLG